jgi:hypothetical protein
MKLLPTPLIRLWRPRTSRVDVELRLLRMIETMAAVDALHRLLAPTLANEGTYSLAMMPGVGIAVLVLRAPANVEPDDMAQACALHQLLGRGPLVVF